MKRLVILVTVLLVATAAWAVDWDTSFEGEGDTDTTVEELPDFTNETRRETGDRGETELCWGTFDAEGCHANDETDSTVTDSGRSREGSARVFMEDDAPTALHALDQDGSATLDQGRLWVESDSTPDNLLQVYDTSQFDDVHVRSTAVQQGSFNLVYNGSFEATDGTGEDDSATGTPAGFSVIDAATFTYGDTADPDVRWGDGIYLIATDVDGTDGFSVVLNNLDTATTYRVVARVAEEDASDICTVTTTGALVDMTSAVSAGVAWQTLTGTFTTHLTVLDDVTVTFVSTAAGDICNWDNIAVYQLDTVTANRDEISMPGTIALWDTYTDATTAVPSSQAAVPTLGIRITPPSQGWIVHVGYTISAGDAGDDYDHFVTCNLDEGGSDVTGTLHANGPADMGTSRDINFSITSNYININPAPGVELVYTVECITQTLGPDYNGDSVDSTGESNLWLIAHPPR